MYDTGKQDELAWDKVYKQYQHVIFDKIVQIEPLAVTADTKEYGSLNVRDKGGTVIKTAYCRYINDEWNVVVAGLDAENKVKVTTVCYNAACQF